MVRLFQQLDALEGADNYRSTMAYIIIKNRFRCESVSYKALRSRPLKLFSERRRRLLGGICNSPYVHF